MQVEIEIKMGDSTCTAGMEESPGSVSWSGDAELIDYVKEQLSRGYGAAGHFFDMNDTLALDLWTSIAVEFGEKYAELKKGKAILTIEDIELASIEKNGQS